MKDVHGGHRIRMKKRFKERGLQDFEPHNALEFLLFFAIAQKNTNELAHHLLKTFGTFTNVVEAPMEELCKINGVGENTAFLIKLVPEITRYYLNDKYSVGTVLTSTQMVGEFLLPKYVGVPNEVVFIVCLNNKNKVIKAQAIFEGSVNAANISIRKVLEAAILSNAAGVVIAHNHPNGIALPSSADIDTTQKMETALKYVGIRLIDHIIIADDDFVSLADSGLFSTYFK